MDREGKRNASDTHCLGGFGDTARCEGSYQPLYEHGRRDAAHHERRDEQWCPDDTSNALDSAGLWVWTYCRMGERVDRIPPFRFLV